MPAGMPPINMVNIQLLQITQAIIMAHMGLARTIVANNNQKLTIIGGLNIL
jgi:hypothetical protein